MLTRTKGKRAVKLLGLPAPKWFQDQSDGCSVPSRTLRFFLKAKETTEACYRHDYMYYFCAILFEVGTPDYAAYRMKADYTLRLNRTRIGKNWLYGHIFGRLYYRGVRIGGKKAMKICKENLSVPPNMFELDRLRRQLHLIKRTERSETILAYFEGVIKGRKVT